MKALAIRLAAGAVLWAVGSVPLSAMPAAKLAAAASDLALEQNVRWVCARHRCSWRADSYRPRATYGYGSGFYSYGPSLYGYAPGWLGYGPNWYAGGYGAGLYGGGGNRSRLPPQKRKQEASGHARGGTGSPCSAAAGLDPLSSRC